MTPKSTTSRGGSGPSPNSWFLWPISLLLKRHLDLFNRFGTVHARAQQTHRQTTLQLRFKKPFGDFLDIHTYTDRHAGRNISQSMNQSVNSFFETTQYTVIITEQTLEMLSEKHNAQWILRTPTTKSRCSCCCCCWAGDQQRVILDNGYDRLFSRFRSSAIRVRLNDRLWQHVQSLSPAKLDRLLVEADNRAVDVVVMRETGHDDG